MNASWKVKESNKHLTVAKVPQIDLIPKAHVNPLLPQPPFCFSIVAPRTAGKTNLLLDLLLDFKKFREIFEVIWIWSASFYHDPKWRNIKLPRRCVQETYDPEYTSNIFKMMCEQCLKKPLHWLMIFDDMIDQNIMDKVSLGPLEAAAMRARHYGGSVIIISQMYMKFSSTVRTNSTNIVAFRMKNAGEMRKLIEEIQELWNYKSICKIYQFCTQEPYTFLHIDISEKDSSKRFRKNWDQVLELTMEDDQLNDRNHSNKKQKTCQ